MPMIGSNYLNLIHSFSAQEACLPTACPALSFQQSFPCTLYALHLIMSRELSAFSAN